MEKFEATIGILLGIFPLIFLGFGYIYSHPWALLVILFGLLIWFGVSSSKKR
jgi:hypothetical protein